MRMILRLTYFVLFILLSTSLVSAGGIGRIGDPIILPHVKNKVLVLEYDNPETKPWGKEIAQIVAQETLGSIRGVKSVGVVNLIQPVKHITLTADVVKDIAKDQNASVVIWGEFYEKKDSVFLHSHLQIIPAGNQKQSSLGISLETPFGTMLANPPTLMINFAPIALSLKSLEGLHTFYEKTVTMREQPTDQSSKVGALSPGDTYVLLKIKGPWTLIRKKDQAEGWIRYETLETQKELAGVRALVIYTHAILQYIYGNFDAARKTIGHYLEVYGKHQDTMNQSFAHILLGNAKLRGGNLKYFIPKDTKISEDYLAAAKLLPDYSAPIDFYSIARIMEHTSASYPAARLADMQDVEKRLIHSVRTDYNLTSLTNLQIFYKMAQEMGFLKTSTMNSSEYKRAIKNQINFLDEIVAQMQP